MHTVTTVHLSHLCYYSVQKEKQTTLQLMLNVFGSIKIVTSRITALFLLLSLL